MLSASDLLNLNLLVEARNYRENMRTKGKSVMSPSNLESPEHNTEENGTSDNGFQPNESKLLTKPFYDFYIGKSFIYS